MSALDKVEIIPRELKTDHRGWFLKVLARQRDQVHYPIDEIYLTLAYPGQIRGNHYHSRANEWFTVVMGEALLAISDPITHDRRELRLSAEQPITIYVPARIGHAFMNPITALHPMLLITYTDRVYDPEDTIPVNLL